MIAAIGAFDGFHAGHRMLLEESQKLAHRNKTGWTVVTFSPHPDVYFDKSAKLLLSENEKYSEAKFLGIPEVIKLPFEQIRNMHSGDFLEMLRKEYSISGIVVGKDFKFGREAEGDASVIRKYCLDNALLYKIVEIVKYSDGPEIGNKISTCVLREWLRNGKVDIVRGTLKFPCPISGIVVHGDGRGAKIGFPTINITPQPEKMLPAEGVYAVSVLTGFEWNAGALFVGKPPMFKDVRETRIEVHISDFHGDLYDRKVAVFLEDFIRPLELFSDESELAHDIKLCLEKAVRVFKVNHGLDNELYHELRNAFS